MRILIGVLATALLFPLWYAMVGGHIPLFDGASFGMPNGVLFVLVDMTALVVLCWAAMKVVARDGESDPAKSKAGRS